MYQLCDRPAAPFTTLAGDTKGPCVNVGVPTVNGAPIYVGEPELRSMLKAFGWPVPEAHEHTLRQRDEVTATARRLEARVAELEQQVDALRVVAQLGPEPRPEPVPALRKAR